jgi:hypothetical protein
MATPDGTNVIWGPGDMYRAAYGATEPAVTSTAIATAPPSSTWTYCGGTNDGVTIEWEQEFGEALFDQVDMPVESRRTRSSFMVNTNMAEPTFDNFAFSMNSTTTAASGTNYVQVSPGPATAGQTSTYSSIIIDGPGDSVAAHKARFVARKMLNTANPSIAYTKENKTILAVTLKGHFISNSVNAWDWYKVTG